MKRQENSLDFTVIRNQATDKWPAIHAALGIEYQLNRHQPCVGCGGTDRFRADDKDGRGTWICGGGGDLQAGDGFDLIQHVQGCSALEAFEQVANVLGAGLVRKTPVRTHTKPSSTGKRAYGLELWLQACFDDAVVAQHDYVVRKGFQHAHGGGVVEAVRSRLWSGPQRSLLVPIRAHGTGRVIAVQAINAEGLKATFGSMVADDRTPGYLILGNERDSIAPAFVVEGWADAVSLVFLAYEGSACAAVAFGKSRLERIVEQFETDVGRQPLIIGDRP